MIFLAKTQRSKDAKMGTGRCESFFQSVNYSRNAIFDQCLAEVNQQSKSQIGDTQIGQNRLLVNRSDSFDRLDLYDHLAFNDEIRSKAHTHVNSFINDG